LVLATKGERACERVWFSILLLPPLRADLTSRGGLIRMIGEGVLDGDMKSELSLLSYEGPYLIVPS
jgi:hypothetical protein